MDSKWSSCLSLPSAGMADLNCLPSIACFHNAPSPPALFPAQPFSLQPGWTQTPSPSLIQNPQRCPIYLNIQIKPCQVALFPPGPPPPLILCKGHWLCLSTCCRVCSKSSWLALTTTGFCFVFGWLLLPRSPSQPGLLLFGM